MTKTPEVQPRSNSPVLIITGASRGIGAATAHLAAARGYKVCVNYRANQRAAEEVAQTIRQKGGKVIAIQADISNESEVVRLFEEATKQLGPLTALVNNAATVEQQSRLENIDAA